MFSLNEGNRFVVCLQGVDLRKGRTTMKLLHWERGGFVIYYKRMESGRVSHKIFLKEGTGFCTIRWDE